MNKRGQFPGLEDIVYYVVYAIPFILVIAFLIVLPTYLFPEKATAEQIDQDVVIEQISQLEPDDFLTIAVQGQDYAMILYDSNHPDIPLDCNKQSCVCIKKEGRTSCKPVSVSSCNTKTYPCIEGVSLWEIEKEVKPIPLCSKEGKISLGTGCVAESLS
ncbi:hypothetical protein HYV79_04945 [Candidatus Woesearchaeota archaeon]|nr:hypothetical protein [Candidatus Woesearchaeota archaeon]